MWSRAETESPGPLCFWGFWKTGVASSSPYWCNLTLVCERINACVKLLQCTKQEAPREGRAGNSTYPSINLIGGGMQKFTDHVPRFTRRSRLLTPARDLEVDYSSCIHIMSDKETKGDVWLLQHEPLCTFQSLERQEKNYINSHMGQLSFWRTMYELTANMDQFSVICDGVDITGHLDFWHTSSFSHQRSRISVLASYLWA